MINTDHDRRADRAECSDRLRGAPKSVRETPTLRCRAKKMAPLSCSLEW